MDDRQDMEKILWKLYMWHGIRAIEENPEADGVDIAQTVEGNIYVVPFDRAKMEENARAMACALTEAGETEVTCLLHLWKNHCPDMPSWVLRNTLLKLNQANGQARIMLVGETCFSFCTLEQSM